MRVVNCTTAAQYFHLLRRQAALLRRDPLPLVRAHAQEPVAASAGRLHTDGAGHRPVPVRASTTRRPASGRSNVRRLVLCSGKVYVDLGRSERGKTSSHVAICRVEQLAPFPRVALREVLDALSVARGGRVAAGRAGEHGRLGLGSRRNSRRRSATAFRSATSVACAAPARRKGRRRGTRSISGSWSMKRSTLDSRGVAGIHGPLESRSQPDRVEALTIYVQHRRSTTR